MIASPTDTAPARTTTDAPRADPHATPLAVPIPAHFPSDWPHKIARDMLKPGLSFTDLAAQIGISFDHLGALISHPAVEAELRAVDTLSAIRARLVASTSMPLAVNRLIAIIDQPLPKPQGRDPDADARAFCRHANLTIRAINALFRHTRHPAPGSPKRHPPYPRPPTEPTPHAPDPQQPTPEKSTDRPSPDRPSPEKCNPERPSHRESCPAQAPAIPHTLAPVASGTDARGTPIDPAALSLPHSPARTLRAAAGAPRARDRPAA